MIVRAAMRSAMAMRFHYHRARTDVPRLGIREGDRLCHVYSDESIDELLAWGRRHGLEPGKLHPRDDFPHFDAFGELLRHCGDGVSRREFVRDIRRWRAARARGRRTLSAG